MLIEALEAVIFLEAAGITQFMEPDEWKSAFVANLFMQMRVPPVWMSSSIPGVSSDVRFGKYAVGFVANESEWTIIVVEDAMGTQAVDAMKVLADTRSDDPAAIAKRVADWLRPRVP